MTSRHVPARFVGGNRYIASSNGYVPAGYALLGSDVSLIYGIYSRLLPLSPSSLSSFLSLLCPLSVPVSSCHSRVDRIPSHIRVHIPHVVPSELP